jgi:hypothetical protein
MFVSQPGHFFQLLSGELDVVFALDDTLSEGVVSATTTVFVCVSSPWTIREPITCGDFEHWPEDEVHSSFQSDKGSAVDRNMSGSRLGTPGQQAFVDLHIAGIFGVSEAFGFNLPTFVLRDAGANSGLEH